MVERASGKKEPRSVVREFVRRREELKMERSENLKSNMTSIWLQTDYTLLLLSIRK